MATVTKHFCDRCAEQITQDRTLLKVACGPERSRRPEIDLCSTCLPVVLELIDSRPAGCVAPAPRLKQKATA